jgi:hypothetical protein
MQSQAHFSFGMNRPRHTQRLLHQLTDGKTGLTEHCMLESTEIQNTVDNAANSLRRIEEQANVFCRH